jgi:hypothetical protein
MSEQATVAIGQNQLGTLLSFLGFTKSSSIPLSVLQSILHISSVFTSHRIDNETGVSILKSFEDRFGKMDDIHLRVSKFHDFVNNINSTASNKAPFIDSVKSLGLLSKAELEEHAKETGDWSHFLKRSEQDSKNANQTNVVGSEAKVQ